MKQEAKKYAIKLGDENYNVVSDENDQILLLAVQLVNNLLIEVSSTEKQRSFALVALQLATKNITLTQQLESILDEQKDVLKFLEHSIANIF